ncbi:hypothetical protein RchiOBHm_Chr7g0239271 [Rosa chinensis]|uniref:Uncharacterized protein n=1 Tax=Rosa chinensis TaxID=74649 RepID=A0A2P6PHN7_ROSCH|nr:hypothetical protein RchiOBHm_Chr7g0239271 [Rosa chinensis]
MSYPPFLGGWRSRAVVADWIGVDSGLCWGVAASGDAWCGMMIGGVSSWWSGGDDVFLSYISGGDGVEARQGWSRAGKGWGRPSSGFAFSGLWQWLWAYYGLKLGWVRVTCPLPGSLYHV